MGVRQRILDDALGHLRAARAAMGKLTAASGDWTGAVVLSCEFDEIEAACRAFARNQLGLSEPRAGRGGSVSGGGV